MNHVTKVVKHERSQDQFIIHLLCCEEHEHRHTVSLEVALNQTNLNSSVEIAKKEASENHEKTLQAIRNLDSLVKNG